MSVKKVMYRIQISIDKIRQDKKERDKQVGRKVGRQTTNDR